MYGRAQARFPVLAMSAAGTLVALMSDKANNISPVVIAQLLSQPWLEDVGPSIPAGVDGSTAGATLAVAGTQQHLYAVSFNAGVWAASDSGPWSQLPTGPPYAYSITVDPGDDHHVVIGERAGDIDGHPVATPGVWETKHGGYGVWNVIPFALRPGDCAAGGRGSVLRPLREPICRNCLWSRAGSAPGADHHSGRCAWVRNRAEPPGPLPDQLPVTAFSESLTATGAYRIWARTGTPTGSHILFSDDGGASWTLVEVPAMVDHYGTTGGNRRNADWYSLAAFGDGVCFFFRPDDNTPPDVFDPKPPKSDNWSTLLIYDDRS